jgi:hypothetical protein
LFGKVGYSFVSISCAPKVNVTNDRDSQDVSSLVLQYTMTTRKNFDFYIR